MAAQAAASTATAAGLCPQSFPHSFSSAHLLQAAVSRRRHCSRVRQLRPSTHRLENCSAHGGSTSSRGSCRGTGSRGGVAVRAMYVDDDDDGNGGLVDAPVLQGDGFSFVGGKYSDEGVGRLEEWEARGSFLSVSLPKGAIVKAASDPLFGLRLGRESQTADAQALQWFVVDTASSDPTQSAPPPLPSSSSSSSLSSPPPLLLLHGLPSLGYSFRDVIDGLAPSGVRCIAPDWPGFGLSEKPQPGYGFEYSLAEYVAGVAGLVEALELDQVAIAAQGYFAPAAVKYAIEANAAAAANGSKLRVTSLILINAPLTEAHAKLPSPLSAFCNPLLGEIFAQDPLRASDRLLEAVGRYAVEEEDAMVYRRPYLISGAAGFALTTVTRALQKTLKGTLADIRKSFKSAEWQSAGVPVTVIWGKRDNWLRFDGVREFCREIGASLVELDEVGHHAQEDYGEQVAAAIGSALKRSVQKIA